MIFFQCCNLIFNSHLTGMPHIHGVAWIDESTLNDFGIKDQFLCDGREENVTKLVDALISCEIPEPLPLTQFSTEEEKRQFKHDQKLKKIVTEVQTHRHTPSCQKYNGSCRYGFPKFPCKKTILAEPIRDIECFDMEDKKKFDKEKEKKFKKYSEILENAKKLLEDKNLELLIQRKIVIRHLDEYIRGENPDCPEKDIIAKVFASNLDEDFTDQNYERMVDEIISRMREKGIVVELDSDAELNIFCEDLLGVYYKEYEEALKTTKKGKILFLKRRIKERWINNYNPEMLYAWDANMDIQIAIDPYAVITYVVSYMNKDETQMTKFMMEALNNNAKQNAKEKLKSLKMAYLTHRQVGASEATYRSLAGMKLKDSNIGCVFVMTGFPQNRSHFWKKVVEGENVHEAEHDWDIDSIQEDENPDGGIAVKLAGKDGYYKQTVSVHDRYAARPGGLERICLAQFATSYVPMGKLPKKANIDEDGCSKNLSSQKVFNSDIYLPKYINLNDGMGCMRLRTYPAVLRFHSSKRKEGHEQHYSELLLFAHWRDETSEFHVDSIDDCVAEHESRILEINANREKMYPGEATIELLDIGDLELRKPEHLADTLDCQGEQNNEDDLDIDCMEDPEFESFGYFGNLANLNEGEDRQKVEADFAYKEICLPSKDEMKHMTRKLVPEQLNVLRKVVASCKSIVRAQKNPEVKPKPLRMLIHGGAGND